MRPNHGASRHSSREGLPNLKKGPFLTAGSECHSLAPTGNISRACCTGKGSNPEIYVGLLRQLNLVRLRPTEELFRELANGVRQVGIQPVEGFNMGGDMKFYLDRTTGLKRSSGVKRDAFGTPAMGMWQVPDQFACLLRHVRSVLGERVRRTACVGTWSGWTDLILAAYLTQLNPRLKHHTFDVHNLVSNCPAKLLDHYGVKRVHNGWYGGKESWAPLGLMDQYDGAYPARWRAPVLDFCLIDGGHSYSLANRDFKTMRTACRVIAFHDIVSSKVGKTEQPQLWKDLTNSSHTKYAHEFSSSNCTQMPLDWGLRPHDVMGFGILTRKELQFDESA